MGLSQPTSQAIFAYVLRLAAGQAEDPIVALGPSGTCAESLDTTVSIQPVVFSSLLVTNIGIAPFRDGHTYTINNAPTDFVVTMYIITTKYHYGVFMTILSAGDSVLHQSGGVGTSSISHSRPTVPTGVITSSNSGPTSSDQGSIATAANTTAAGSVTTNTSPISSAAPLSLGAKLPSDKIESFGLVPSKSPIVLGYVSLPSFNPDQVAIDRLNRRQTGTTTSASDSQQPLPSSEYSTVVATALAIGTPQHIADDSEQGTGCNVSSAYMLNNGQLSNNGSVIGKPNGTANALFGEAVDPTNSDFINDGFYFVDGILSY